MDRAVFSPPRWRLLLLAATTAVVFLAGLLLIQADLGFWRVTGYVLAAGFCSATVVLMIRALRPGPTVVIDRSGIVDRTSLLPTGRLRWEEIAAVRKREIGRGVGRERLLEVVLFDPRQFRSRPRGVARRLVGGYRSLLRVPDVTIPGSMVAAPLHQVVEAIQEHQPRVDVLELPPPDPGLASRLFRSRSFPAPRQHPRPPQW